jgi:hypothetical protein
MPWLSADNAPDGTDTRLDDADAAHDLTRPTRFQKI